MYTKVVKYEDYDGNERTKTCRFNLSKAELVDMQLSKDGGMEAFINKITEARDSKELAKLFKELILMSYGEKSLDGERFIKSPELSEAFSQTDAYSQIYMSLITDADAAQAFINGLLPKDLQKQVEKMKAEGKLPSVEGAQTTPIE